MKKIILITHHRFNINLLRKILAEKGIRTRKVVLIQDDASMKNFNIHIRNAVIFLGPMHHCACGYKDVISEVEGNPSDYPYIFVLRNSSGYLSISRNVLEDTMPRVLSYLATLNVNDDEEDNS